MFKEKMLPEDIDKLPLGQFSGKIVVVDHIGLTYTAAVHYLSRQKFIGFDTETKPVFQKGAKHHNVALLQLSGPDKAFLFRLNKMGLRSRLCNKVLSNPAVLKIGAASMEDVHGLQRLTKFKSAGFLDLQQIVSEWGIADKSVKKMAANILGIRISKAQQCSNWEAENLTVPQQAYAAMDAWVCREMYLKLMDSPKNPLKTDNEQGNS